jgi:hypothetical protein
MTRNSGLASPPLVALAGWVLPGLGHWLIGERTRGTTIGATIITLFLLGLLLSGIRVIDVPGFDDSGAQVRLDAVSRRIERGSREYVNGQWALTSRGFVGEIANKPWFVPQVLAGPITLISARLSLMAASEGVPRSHARLLEIGTLYTAIAGMLNLLAIIDAADRAGRGAQPE